MKLRVPRSASASSIADLAPHGLPIAGDPRPDDYALAPPPQIDKYPIVIGPGLSLAYISSIFRLSTTGFRQQYVDLLEEMLEKDPHAYSIIAKRANGVAGGRLELAAPPFEEGSNDEKAAQEVLAVCQSQVDEIPDLAEHLTSLAWGVFWAISGLENHWLRDGRGWQLERFSFIHSRRLAYPRPMSWDLHVWDQGLVGNPFSGPSYSSIANPFAPYSPPKRQAPTEGMFGLRVADFPGKFTIHAPQVRGSYPTREGVGRQIAYWMALKLIAARGAPQYLERFARPWPEAKYATGDGDAKRKATTDDINQARAVLNAMGAGSLASWVHPDSIELALLNPDGGKSAKVTFGEWIGICDGQMSKAVLGGTLTTEVGSTGGNRALGETQKKGETVLFKQDARMLASTFRRDVLKWIVLLNFGPEKLRYTPIAHLHVEDDPDPGLIVDRAVKAAGAGVPVDADWLAEEVGLRVTKIGPEGQKQRRMYPILGTKDPEAYDLDLAERVDSVKKKFPPPPPPPGLAPFGGGPPGAADGETPPGAPPKPGAEPPNDAPPERAGAKADPKTEPKPPPEKSGTK